MLTSFSLTGIDSYGKRGLHSDLKLICNGHEFAVHKFILSVQSEYFNKLINGPFIVSLAIASHRLELDS